MTNGVGKVSDGVRKVSDGVGTVSEGVGKVSDGVRKMSILLAKEKQPAKGMDDEDTNSLL